MTQHDKTARQKALDEMPWPFDKAIPDSIFNKVCLDWMAKHYEAIRIALQVAPPVTEGDMGIAISAQPLADVSEDEREELTHRDMIDGAIYKLRDGRRGIYVGKSRGEYVFLTSVKTSVYSTKRLEGILFIEEPEFNTRAKSDERVEEKGDSYDCPMCDGVIDLNTGSPDCECGYSLT